jgi:hypothetical protein
MPVEHMLAAVPHSLEQLFLPCQKGRARWERFEIIPAHRAIDILCLGGKTRKPASESAGQSSRGVKQKRKTYAITQVP